MSHDTDFYTWTQEQAALLRQGRFHDLDIANLLEEIEDMGRSERRELESRLIVLLAHLLKWKYQPKRRGNSWRATIKGQRKNTLKILSQNPGLQPLLQDLKDNYEDARLLAVKETNLHESVFPDTCPWMLNQIFDEAFWPE